MMSLLNFEWDLLPNAARKLYLTCIVPIADYRSEIWFQPNDQKQKHFLILFFLFSHYSYGASGYDEINTFLGFLKPLSGVINSL